MLSVCNTSSWEKNQASVHAKAATIAIVYVVIYKPAASVPVGRPFPIF